MSDFDVAEFHYKKAKKLLERVEKEEYDPDRQALLRLVEVHLEIWDKTRNKPRDPSYRLGWP